MEGASLRGVTAKCVLLMKIVCRDSVWTATAVKNPLRRRVLSVIAVVNARSVKKTILYVVIMKKNKGFVRKQNYRQRRLLLNVVQEGRTLTGQVLMGITTVLELVSVLVTEPVVT